MDEAKPHGAKLVRPSEVVPATPPAANRLAAALARMPPHVFAVVDGGHWDDVSASLAAVGLNARSLFLGDTTRDVQRYGPWLVLLDKTDAVGRLLALTSDKPTPVFWSCSLGEGAFYRHLRTLNQAEIPEWAARGAVEPSSTGDEQATSVLFRHWDPNVLGGLLPLMDADQFVRLFGPAEALVFETPDFGGVRRAFPVEGVAPRGPLRLRSDQILTLGEQRLAASDRRVAAFLRAAAPNETTGRSDTELASDVVRLRQMSMGIGLQEEPSQAWWAYLMVATGGDVGRNTRVTRYLAHGTSPGTPDERMRRFMKDTLMLARSDNHSI